MYFKGLTCVAPAWFLDGNISLVLYFIVVTGERTTHASISGPNFALVNTRIKFEVYAELLVYDLCVYCYEVNFVYYCIYF